MNLNFLNKLLFGIFFLFLIFVSIVVFVGEYQDNTLLSIVVFVAILYFVYYLAIRFFLRD